MPEELFEGAKGRTISTRARKDPPTRKLVEAALQQVVRGRLEGPFKYTDGRLLRKEGRNLIVYKQGDMFRAGGDLKRSLADKATMAHTPINLHSWGRIA